ncbi:MAG TPA: HEAT repeat domain-containing protein [Pyrinomonadaceae bacterium]
MDKLRIFISGTQLDMLAERDAVGRAVEAVSLAESVRAEQTLSRPQPPKEWIVEQVRSCDIYLGVYSHRYGWVIPEDNVSATEFEFDLAVRFKKPVLAWARRLREPERALPDFERQQQFLARVFDFTEGYFRQEFERTEELERWVADALRQTFVSLIRSAPAPSSNSEPPPVDAYLEELAGQRPYVLWGDESYIERDVARGEDYFARIVTPFDPQRSERERRARTEPVEDALAREQKLILLGEPGLGKTTSLLHLAWDSATRARAEKRRPATGVEVPVYIELKYYNGEDELETLITRRLNDILRPRRRSVEPESVRAWMERPGTRLLLLLDGLNEVRPDFHTEVRGLLQPWLGSAHRVVVACRERDYDYSLRDHAPAYVLQGLQENEIREYLRRDLGDAGVEVFDGQIRWDPKMRTLAGNPLMLWLISNVVRDEPGARLPTNRGRLFQKFIGLMPRLRASEKFGTRVPVYVVNGALARLGFEMQTRGVLTADLADAARWCGASPDWRLEDVLAQAKEWRFLKSDGRLGERIEFLHQLFLEYFAAARLEELLREGRSYARVLGEKPFAYRWNEITAMLAGIHERPVNLVRWLGARVLAQARWHAAFLVERCWETSEAHGDEGCRRMLVELFAEALKAEEEETRKGAAEALGKLKDPRAADWLVEGLRDPSVYVSRGAAKALAELNPPVSERLVALLADEDANVRRRAVEVLAHVEDARAVGHLIDALKDEDLIIRREASEALAKRRDPRAVLPLIDALGDADGWVRFNAAEGLGNTGDPRAVEALAAVLDEEEFSLGRRAAEALAQVGVPAVEALASAARGGDASARRRAVEALGRIGDARAVSVLAETMRDPDPEVRTYAAEALTEIGPPAVDVLIALLSDADADVRGNAMTALGAIRDERAVAPLLDALRDADAAIRRAAATALHANAGPEAVGPLIDALQDEDAQVCLYASEVLVNIGAPAVEHLVAAVKNEGWATAYAPRETAAHFNQELEQRPSSTSRDARIGDVLVKIGAPAVAPLIRKLRDPWAFMRRFAADALERIRDPRCVEPFLAALRDKDYTVRTIAVDVVLELSGVEAIGPLASALEDENHEVRRVAVQALVKLGAPAVEHLGRALADADFQVRRVASHALKGTRDPRCEKALVKALRDEVPDIRRAAAEALGTYDSDEVTDALLEAVNDDARLVRTAALGSLRMKRAARAARSLAALVVNHPDPTTRTAAAEALETAGAAAVETLADAFRHRARSDKEWVIYALTLVGEPAVKFLIEALGDPDQLIRSKAADALGVVGAEEAVRPLLAALGDADNEVCTSAVRALSRLNQPAVQPLIDLVLTGNGALRGYAAEALEPIRDPRCVDTFIRLLKDEDVYIRRVAVSALYRCGDQRAAEALIAAIDDDDRLVRTGAARAMRFVNDPRAVPRLVSALTDEDETVRYYASETLTRLGAHAVDPLIEFWRRGGDEMRERAVSVLKHIKDPRAVEPLIHALRCGAAERRDGIIDALALIGDPAVDSLSELLRDESAMVRASAVSALARIWGERASARVATALRDADVNVRRWAARALSRNPAANLVAPLIEALRDEDASVRRHSTFALVKIGDAAVDPLINALRISKREPDAARGEAGQRPEAVEALLDLIKDPASHTRGRARGAGRTRLDPQQLEALVMALDDADLEVRHCSRLLLNSAGGEGVRALIKRLTGEGVE